MSKCREHFEAIKDTIQRALDAGIRVHIGGDPAVIQVTLDAESYAMRTFREEITRPLKISEAVKTALELERALNPEDQAKKAVTDLTISNLKKQNLDGATGNFCVQCGSPLYRSGTCEVCRSCGTTSGCS